MKQSFRDKVAIVTGGASGIGKAICHTLYRQNATVIVADIDFAKAKQAASGADFYSQKSNQFVNGAVFPGFTPMKAVELDVSQAESVQQLVDAVVSEHGRLDYMFNNAGIAISGEIRDTSLEQWNRIIDVNLKGVIHGVMAAYPQMIKQGYGHIINTASLAGLVPSPGLGAYSTTKHAVVGLSTNLRAEAAGLGVKVSAVCPGFIKTNLFETTTYNNTSKEDMLKLIPFKLIEADQAVQLILEGVLKNKAMITLPAYAKVSWLLQRFNPNLISFVNRTAINKLRQKRINH